MKKIIIYVKIISVNQSYYNILGVEHSSTKDEIKTAYHNLMKKYHPDTFPGDKVFAEQKTIQINEAYRVLSDENLRKQYDETILANGINNNESKANENEQQDDFVERAKQNVKQFFKDLKQTIVDGFLAIKNNRLRKRSSSKSKEEETKNNFFEEKAETKKSKCINNKVKHDLSEEEKKENKKLTIIICVLVSILAFFILIGICA